MSRLTSHQRKEEDKKIIYLIGGLVLFVIFFIVFGFKLILNGAAFVGKATTKDKITENIEDDFYGTISIDSFPAATNSATFEIQGSTQGFDSVEFYINNKKIKKISLGQSNQFSAKLTGLEKGQNEIIAKAFSTKHTQTKETDIHTIFYKAEKLTLEISSPADNDTVNTEEVTIVGKTDTGSTVTVNSQPAVVDGTGTFQKPIRLKEGDNKVKVYVEDIGGNTIEKEITIKYQKDD